MTTDKKDHPTGNRGMPAGMSMSSKGRRTAKAKAKAKAKANSNTQALNSAASVARP